jgi:hypothetical protein
MKLSRDIQKHARKHAKAVFDATDGKKIRNPISRFFARRKAVNTFMKGVLRVR